MSTFAWIIVGADALLVGFVFRELWRDRPIQDAWQEYRAARRR